MAASLERFRADFERLQKDSVKIEQAFQLQCYGKEYEAALLKACNGDKDAAKAP